MVREYNLMVRVYLICSDIIHTDDSIIHISYKIQSEECKNRQ